MQSKYKKATRYIQKSWYLSDRRDVHGMKIYFVLLDRLGAMNKLIEEVDDVIELFRARLVKVTEEIKKIDNDELLMQAAVKKQNNIMSLLFHALRRKTQDLVFQGEFDSAVKLYEEAKIYATSEEEDKFFDLLFNQKVINFGNVKIAKEVTGRMARTSMIFTAERKKFISQVNARVDTMDEISFFTLCLLKKTTVVNLFQLEMTNLNHNTEHNLKIYWAKVQSYCKTGVDLKLLAMELMGWEHL